jgi:hypothetical protein
MSLTVFRSTESIPYTGPELRPHFILSRFRIEGSAIVAFRGPCRVETAHLVDWEDRLASDHIAAKEMVHFLGEFFGITLREGVWIQRHLVQEAAARLRAKGLEVSRDGDDLFLAGGKLSVSIVTASPVSVLLHLGINLDPEGAPVRAAGLAGVLGTADINGFIDELLSSFEREWTSVNRATVKVKPVI